MNFLVGRQKCTQYLFSKCIELVPHIPHKPLIMPLTKSLIYSFRYTEYPPFWTAGLYRWVSFEKKDNYKLYMHSKITQDFGEVKPRKFEEYGTNTLMAHYIDVKMSAMPLKLPVSRLFTQPSPGIRLMQCSCEKHVVANSSTRFKMFRPSDKPLSGSNDGRI